MASLGGRREGAGRKKGSVNKLKLKERFSEKEIQEFIDQAKEMSKTDANMLKFILEQIFGRASQSVTLKGDEDNPISVIVSIEGELKNWAKK